MDTTSLEAALPGGRPLGLGGRIYRHCVKNSTAKGELEGLNILVGDQGDPKVLDEWIQQSGGEFDVIIDDGGHIQCQIWTSFEKLWPTVKPGGGCTLSRTCK